VDFTNKYYQTPAKFVAKKGAGYEITAEGLKGKNVGVQRATVHENFVRD
jgi:arginine/ornithine transport system substrate-binding protein